MTKALLYRVNPIIDVDQFQVFNSILDMKAWAKANKIEETDIRLVCVVTVN